MPDKLHFAVDWKPVCMHVCEAHEDAYHQAAVVKIGVFVNLLDDNNLAVSRSHYYITGIFYVKIAYGTLIKVNDDGINDAINDDEKPKGPLLVKREP